MSTCRSHGQPGSTFVFFYQHCRQKVQQCYGCKTKKSSRCCCNIWACTSLHGCSGSWICDSGSAYYPANKFSAQLEKELEDIKLELHDLVKGKLSPFLLPPHVLKSSIHQVQNIITEKFQHFQISNIDPLFYYSFGEFIFTRLHSHLYLTLKIPISSFRLPLSVFKVYSFPVPVNSTSNHATQLEAIPPYFHYTEDNQHYATFSNQQIAQGIYNNVLWLQHCPNSLSITKLFISHLFQPKRFSYRFVWF